MSDAVREPSTLEILARLDRVLRKAEAELLMRIAIRSMIADGFLGEAEYAEYMAKPPITIVLGK